jgi:hypothetical protein
LDLRSKGYRTVVDWAETAVVLPADIDGDGFAVRCGVAYG